MPGRICASTPTVTQPRSPTSATARPRPCSPPTMTKLYRRISGGWPRTTSTRPRSNASTRSAAKGPRETTWRSKSCGPPSSTTANSTSCTTSAAGPRCSRTSRPTGPTSCSVSFKSPTRRPTRCRTANRWSASGGMGFNDANHPWDTNACLDVITWFKNQGCYVMGGVPTWWRTGVSDSRSSFLSAYIAFDMISPWMVGRIGNISGADSFYSNPELGDQAYCNSHGIDYQPCVLPGDTGQRAHGDFMWRQFYNMTRLGCQGIYISMFDEFNEGNQIACTAENSSMIPVGSCALYFTLDQDGTSCSSDYYLRLSGDGGKMFKGQIALITVRPTLPRVPATLPPSPTNLVAQAGNAKVSLTWAAAAGAERYAVKRSIAGIGQFTTLSTNVGLLSFTDSGLVNGTIYFYAVSAASGVGESTNSLPVGAIPYSTAASASSDNPPNETAAKAFDGLTSTKWFNANAGTTGWLRHSIGGPPLTVVRYDLDRK